MLLFIVVWITTLILDTDMINLMPVQFGEKKVIRFKNPPQDEQELVREFFENKKNGFYVDVGANDPIIESQSYHLEKSGWMGLLIEPLSSYCNDLKEKRTGVVIQNACSAPENHLKTLRLLVAGGHSTLNENPIALGTKSQEYVDVTCKTLDSILTENAVKLNFDFISIDIEGHELEMFKGFSIQKWRPKLVLLEDHVLNHKKHKLMISNGYKLLMRTGLNSWYVSQSMGYKLTPFAYLQYFRKYYIGILLRKFKYRR